MASHLVGDQLQQMVQSFEKGDIQAATQIHLQLFPLFKALFLTANPIPVKAALALQGWTVGRPRLPLNDAPPEIVQTLQSILKDLELLPIQ